jgi:outer membrane lipoprotein-sorting protein
MFQNRWSTLVVFACAVSITSADTPPPVANLTAQQIADKNVAARGGLQAWRNVQSLELSGKLTAGGNQRSTIATTAKRPSEATVPPRPAEEVQLPFVMKLKRPRKMRFELQFNGQTAVQVFDGSNGWKLRPFLNRRVVEPYTPEELKIAGMQSDLDGALIDYTAKGTRLDLDGTEKVEGRDTYRLKLTMKGGNVVHVWIDSQTFLETKIEAQPRRLDGVDHPVETYFRDYRQVSGIRIPYVLETKVLPLPQTATAVRQSPIPPERTTLEKVEVNPKLDDSAFTKPTIEIASATH